LKQIAAAPALVLAGYGAVPEPLGSDCIIGGGATPPG
jgi:hypothetical protein